MKIEKPRRKNENNYIKTIPLDEVKNKIMLKVGLLGSRKWLKPIKSITEVGISICTLVQSRTNTKQHGLLLQNGLKRGTGNLTKT